MLETCVFTQFSEPKPEIIVNKGEANLLFDGKQIERTGK